EEHREHGHVVGEPGRDGHDQVPRQHHARVHAGEQAAAGGVGGAQQLEAHPVDAEHVTGLAGHQRTSGWAESETAGPDKAGSEKAGPEKAVSETAGPERSESETAGPERSVSETAGSVQVALARPGPGRQARSSAAVRGSGSRPSSSAMRAACGGTSRACAVTPGWEKSSRGLTSASTAPWSSTSTRLAQVATSSMSWVATTAQRTMSERAASMAVTSSRERMSRLEVGSSSSRRLGRIARP